ncbi:MAG TPA: ATP-binding protein [Polyangiaceae bacterium]|nr:ATP-binding protein [Polyangiaceae bacterium]
MSKRRSLEANLISLGIAAGSLLAVLLLTLFIVERALGSKVERLGSSSVPAQQSITGLEHAMSDLFERQSKMRSTSSEQELTALADRIRIERKLADSQRDLANVLPELLSARDAEQHSKKLADRAREMLANDAQLFDSIKARRANETHFDERASQVKTGLDKLNQDARAVAGNAHLDFVLELRRVEAGGSPEQVVHGNARAQQDAAVQVMTAVLQLGQLVGKVALSRNEDELNSVVANELTQNVSRAKSYLSLLATSLSPSAPTAKRVGDMRSQFDTLSVQISAADDPYSLVRLRRASLEEAQRASAMRERTQQAALALSQELARAEAIVANETQSATRSARRTLWTVRGLSLLAFLAAALVGARQARRLRESVGGLRAQNQELESLSRDLKQMNEGLEGLVVQRSAELAERERSMRLVLDSMSEALITVDLTGQILGESSKMALAWFGRPESGRSLWAHLFPNDAKRQAAYQAGFQQVAEDIMPFEVSAACLPRHFERGEQTFSMSLRQVFEQDRFARVLLVIHDVTEQVAIEAREQDASEQHQLLGQLLRDKQGFRVFVRDGEKLLLELRNQPTREVAQRALHTLKGNAGVCGMVSVARRCHALEEALADSQESLSAAASKSLTELWRSRLARIEELLTTDGQVEVNERELSELSGGLRDRRDYNELLEIVESWKWTKTSVLLQRLASQAHRVAEGLGKHVDVRVDHHYLRITPGPLDDFWSALIHVARNAVDHGIEDADEREACGKPATGCVTLRSVLLDRGGFAIELADDGRGVDFEKLKRTAEAITLSATTRDELIALMFRDGVSTRSEVTEISGRGIGLGAASAACRAAGGVVSVQTEPGKGSCFRFEFPLQAVRVSKPPSISLRPPGRSGSGLKLVTR